MVSSVFVELMGDDDISCTLSGESGEVGKCISGRDGTLGVGKEGMFSMKVKIVPAHGPQTYTQKPGD